MSRRIDLTGKTYGCLTVTLHKWGGKRSICECVCSCGTRVDVMANSLRTGNTRSCGCLLPAITSARNRSHGKSKTSENMIWSQMIQRCFNPNCRSYYLYGRRGIKVCEEWRSSFETFLKDVGPKPSPSHSIDRIDVNGNYEPKNVKWSTRKEQARNKRDTRWITHNGVTKCLSEWAEDAGLPQPCLQGRILLGWPMDLALSVPNGKYRNFKKRQPFKEK